uniref:Putative replicase n=1 Tax=Magsystermes virus TaxID=2796612 RepID=A0A7T7GV15_9VIRU|nr:putative replicase [Magsystermes virus]
MQDQTLTVATMYLVISDTGDNLLWIRSEMISKIGYLLVADEAIDRDMVKFLKACKVAINKLYSFSESDDFTPDYTIKEELPFIKSVNSTANPLVDTITLENKDGSTETYQVDSEWSLFKMAYESSQSTIEKDMLPITKDAIDDAFTHVIMSNDKDELREGSIRNPLPFIFNCHELERLNNLQLVSDYADDLCGHEDPLADAIGQMLNVNITSASVLPVHVPMENSTNKGLRYNAMPVEASNTLSPSVAKLLSDLHSVENMPKAPKAIKSIAFEDAVETCSSIMSYLGRISLKPSRTIKNNFGTPLEQHMSATVMSMYDLTSSLNGTHYMEATEFMVERMLRWSTHECRKDKFITPPSGAGILICGGGHAPMSKLNVQIPYVSICRQTKKDRMENGPLPFPVAHTFIAGNHYYYVGKTMRMPIEKLSKLQNVAHRTQAATVTLADKIKSKPEEIMSYFGELCVLATDLHQAPSDLLDLLKYLGWQTIAEYNNAVELVKDKMSILRKNITECWIIDAVHRFMVMNLLNGYVRLKIPRIQLGRVNPMTLGEESTELYGVLTNVKHTSTTTFVEEMAILFGLRPKKLYGTQYLDRNIGDLVDRERQYRAESGQDLEDDNPMKDALYNHVFHGYLGQPGTFTFKEKFGWSYSAIAYATMYAESHFGISQQLVMDTANKETLSKWMPQISTLRGCMKMPADRQSPQDLTSSAIDEAVKVAKATAYKDSSNTILALAVKSLSHRSEYNIAAKEQRGGGRPIVSPTVLAKASMRAIEAVEMAIGQQCPNNIIVTGRNKLSYVHENYKNVVVEGNKLGHLHIMQGTEDKSKWSEEDNMRKAQAYFAASDAVPRKYRQFQWDLLQNNFNRVHRRKTFNQQYSAAPNFVSPNGIKCTHGWPQGMYNHLSTTFVSYAGVWIMHLWNKYAGSNKQVYMRDEVHSDDSHFTITSNSKATMKEFMLFRKKCMRYFALLTNDKKTYMGSSVGEMTSNFCIGGDMVQPYSKTVIGAFNSLQHWSFEVDIENSLSALSQMLQQGATIGIMTLVYNLLTVNVRSTYKFPQDWNQSLLPIELGGIPKVSPFALALTSRNAYNSHIVRLYKEDEDYKDTKEWKAIKGALSLSVDFNEDQATSTTIPIMTQETLNAIRENPRHKVSEYSCVRVQDVKRAFGAIGCIIPVPPVQQKTIQNIMTMKIPEDIYANIRPHATDLKECLAGVKARAGRQVYQLAASGYSQSVVRMAHQRNLARNGKVWTIGKRRHTLQELLEALSKTPSKISDETALRVLGEMPVEDNTIMSIVEMATIVAGNLKVSNVNITNHPPKGHIDRPTIVLPLKLALLNKCSPMEAMKYGIAKYSAITVEADMDRLNNRYGDMFNIYGPVIASELILSRIEYMSKATYRTTPIPSSTLTGFYLGLYGASLSNDVMYKLVLDRGTNGYMEDKERLHTLAQLQLYSAQTGINIMPTTVDSKPVRAWLGGVNKTELDYYRTKEYYYLAYMLDNDPSILDAYLDNKGYRQHYYTPQRRNKRTGQWYGAIDAVASVGHCTVRFQGDPGNVLIRSNCHSVSLVLHVMRLFHNINFPDRKYKADNLWGETKFFRTRDKNSYSSYLTYQSPLNTQLIDKVYENKVQLSFTVDSSVHVPGASQSDKVITDIKLADNHKGIIQVQYDNKQTHSTTFQGKVNVYQQLLKVNYYPHSLNFNGMSFDGQLEHLPMQELVDHGVMNAMLTEDWTNVNVEHFRHLLAEDRNPFIAGSVLAVIARAVSKHGDKAYNKFKPYIDYYLSSINPLEVEEMYKEVDLQLAETDMSQLQEYVIANQLGEQDDIMDTDDEIRDVLAVTDTKSIRIYNIPRMLQFLSKTKVTRPDLYFRSLSVRTVAHRLLSVIQDIIDPDEFDDVFQSKLDNLPSDMYKEMQELSNLIASFKINSFNDILQYMHNVSITTAGLHWAATMHAGILNEMWELRDQSRFYLD